MNSDTNSTRTASTIRGEIDAARDDLTATLDEVVNHRFDIREQIARHPIEAVAVAAGVAAIAGLWLGGRIGRHRALLGIARHRG